MACTIFTDTIRAIALSPITGGQQNHTFSFFFTFSGGKDEENDPLINATAFFKQTNSKAFISAVIIRLLQKKHIRCPPDTVPKGFVSPPVEPSQIMVESEEQLLCWYHIRPTWKEFTVAFIPALMAMVVPATIPMAAMPLLRGAGTGTGAG